MVCRGPERLYCRSREAPAGRDAPARRTAAAAHANRVPRPPRLRRRRRGSGPPVLSTPAASTIPRGRTLSARPRLHRRVRLLPAPLPYTPLTIPIESPSLPVRALPLIARARAMACTRCETRRASRAATDAATSGGHAVVGGGDHARKNQFNYLVLRYRSLENFLVCMWARSLALFCQQRFHRKLKLQQSKQDGAHPRYV